MKNKTTLSKQKNLIILLSCLAVFFAAACIAFPLIFKEQLNTVYKLTEYGDEAIVAIYDIAEGRSLKGDIENIRQGAVKNNLDVKESTEENVLYTFRKNDVEITYQPFIFPEISLTELSQATITNENGTFTLFGDTNGNFFIKGAEKNLYNKQLLSELVLQLRYMLADRYVDNPEKDEVYGLTEDKCLAKAEIVSRDGSTHTVYVGNRELGGSRYYMKHADKEQIYVMDSSVSALFNDVRFYLAPNVVKPLDEQQSNYLSDFEIYKNDELFFACEIIPDQERVGVLANQLHRMTYPAKVHVLSIETLYDTFRKAGALSGAGVMEYAVSEKEKKDEIFSFYGLDKPSYTISYSFDGTDYNIYVGKKEKIDDAEYYYVYSEYQDTVVPVDVQSLDFLEYDIVSFFQENVFQYNVNEVSSIELKYSGKTLIYDVSGQGDSLSVTERTTGKAVDVPSFRQFYISLLNVTIGGYSSLSGIVADTNKHELTFTVTLDSGENIVFDFYGESTMSCHMIIDGKGGFKTDRKWIDKIAQNSEKLMNDQAIASEF